MISFGFKKYWSELRPTKECGVPIVLNVFSIMRVLKVHLFVVS